MKKFLSLTLGCLLLCTLTTSALANQWGLRGGIYDIVADDERYADYSAVADDGNGKLENGMHVNQAILQNRYHAVLINASRDGKTWVADQQVTTAVYQPGDKRGEYPNTPVLEHIEGAYDGGFKLSYGDEESYTFLSKDGEYFLWEVRYHKNKPYNESFLFVLSDEEELQFWQSNPGEAFLPVGDGRWPTTITLDEFNITQMPRTLAEVRQLTMVSNALKQDAPMLEITGRWNGAKDAGMLAVYSAPDADSYRSAKGKASVSLGGAIAIYGTADGWTLVDYEVSPRTRRFGYVQKALGDEPLAFASVPLRAAADTFLTDDPFVSQYAQTEIPAGAEMTGLAQCGEYYAYVAYQSGETQYRGFVPMKDLIPVYDRAMSTDNDRLTADVRWDVIDALCGKWYPADGNWRDMTILYTNGSFRQRKDGVNRDEGNFRVYNGENGGYTLYMCTEDNAETTYTLTLNEDGTITLKNDKIYTVYRRDEYSSYGNG